MKDDLKERLKFSTVILGTEPDAVYMNKVYTQFVLVEFGNGQKAYVFDGAFDGHMLCTPDMIGKTKELILVMLVLSLERLDTPEIGLDTSLNNQGDYIGPELEIKGSIEEIIIPDDPKDAERWHDAIVDFGIGKILIEIDKKYFHLQLEEGNYVHVYGRVDLQGIE